MNLRQFLGHGLTQHALGRTAIMASTALVLCACQTTDGPSNIFGARGPVKPVVYVDGQAVQDNNPVGLIKEFVDAESRSVQDKQNDDLARTMFNDAYALEYANCNAYFDYAGQNQTWVNFARSATGAIGVVTTSALALHSGNTGHIASVALGTSAIQTGLDLYTKEFLFSTENIESTRTLINNALATNKAAVLAINPLNYDTAATAIIDLQAICTVRHISMLAVEAIKNGTPQASYSYDDDLTSITNASDQTQLKALGSILNPPGTLTLDQAAALWWLLKESSTPAERQNFIAPALKDLPDAKTPFDTAHTYFDASFGYVAAWPLENTVLDRLEKLSPSAQRTLQNSVVAAKKKEATPGFVPATATLKVTPSSPSGHVTISIR